MVSIARDIRLRACVRCGSEFLPPGGGHGTCSDRCFVRSRGERLTGGEQLARNGREGNLASERRRAGNYRVDRYLGAAGLENDVRRYLAERREVLGLISRMRQRSDPGAAYASRGAPSAAREITRGGVVTTRCTHCADSGISAAESTRLHASDPRL